MGKQPKEIEPETETEQTSNPLSVALREHARTTHDAHLQKTFSVLADIIDRVDAENS